MAAASDSKKICDMTFPVTQYQKNNTHHHVMAFDAISLQNPSGTDSPCSQQAAET
jgi:hypothetical protein